ncbi:MAG: TiaS agmantine-binding domain-containing protein [Candidatus Hodarchaeales archaeon]
MAKTITITAGSSMEDIDGSVDFHVSFDDTDSLEGMCTTYLAYRLVQELSEHVTFTDLPWLIRLNPNVPFKTRGNGAVVLHLKVDKQQLERVKKIVIREVEDMARVSDKDRPADPGIVFVTGDIPADLESFSMRALHDFIPLEETFAELDNNGLEFHYPVKGLGLTGALAATGYALNSSDHTYELIAYRDPGKNGPRLISIDSIIAMDRQFNNWTFSNIDSLNGEIKITPRGKDPVLCGIRGENISKLLEAFKSLDISEEILGVMIFKTNQATDQHHQNTPVKLISDAEPYRVVELKGTVLSLPKRIEGGHVYFDLKDPTGEIRCYVYEPAKDFRKIAMSLCPGDEIIAWGGIRPANPELGFDKAVNVEKLEVLSLVTLSKVANPPCPACGKNLTSKGRNQGFYCKKCGVKYPDLEKKTFIVSRDISERRYLPPVSAQRHLAKPFCRYGREKSNPDTLNANDLIINLMKGYYFQGS